MTFIILFKPNWETIPRSNSDQISNHNVRMWDFYILKIAWYIDTDMPSRIV